MKISVVIPNYNGSPYIIECIDCLKKQTFKDFEVIVVDNNSTDNSVDEIENRYPEIKIIEMNNNSGFSSAVNRGIKDSTSEFIFLLNNDAFINSDFLEILYNKIVNDPLCFSCCGKMIQYYDKSKIDDAGDFYTILGWAFQRGNGDQSNLYNFDSQVFSCCAGASIYRRSVFNRIGYFDENFYAYLEDVDIGYRAKQHGYKNYYCHNAVCYHMGSATSGGKYSDFKVKLSSRNNIYLIFKNMPYWQIIISLLFIFLGILLKYSYFKRIGFGKSYKEGIIEGFNNIKLFKKRRTKFFLSLKVYFELILATFNYVTRKIAKIADKFLK